MRARSLRFTEYLFCIQSESSNFPFKETLSLICAEVKQPEPEAAWREFVILEDVSVTAFEASVSTKLEFDFDLLYLVDGTFIQICFSLRSKKLIQTRSTELPNSYLA